MLRMEGTSGGYLVRTLLLSLGTKFGILVEILFLLCTQKYFFVLTHFFGHGIVRLTVACSFLETHRDSS